MLWLIFCLSLFTCNHTTVEEIAHLLKICKFPLLLCDYEQLTTGKSLSRQLVSKPWVCTQLQWNWLTTAWAMDYCESCSIFFVCWHCTAVYLIFIMVSTVKFLLCIICNHFLKCLFQAIAKSVGYKHPVVPQSMYIFKVSCVDLYLTNLSNFILLSN